MTLDERTHLRLMQDTLRPHDIQARVNKGQYVLSFFDKLAGLIRWGTASDFTAYKLGLDMRDNRAAYVAARRLKHNPNTVFFNANHQLVSN